MFYLIRRTLLVVFLVAAAACTSLVTVPPRWLSTLDHLHWLPRAALEGAAVWVHLALTYPTQVLLGLCIVCLPFLVTSLIALIPRRVTKDPQRLFTADQRRIGAERAGGRCEMETIFFTRCRRPGEHGDHWLPHAKGGNSSLDNFVWACAPHNLAKGAHWPTFWETTRLEWRRRRYFPAATTTRPGSKVPT